MIKCPNINAKIRQIENFENVEIFQLFQIMGAALRTFLNCVIFVIYL